MLAEKLVKNINLTNEGSIITLNNGRVGLGEYGSNQWFYNIYMDEGDRFVINFRTMEIEHQDKATIKRLDTIQKIMSRPE